MPAAAVMQMQFASTLLAATSATATPATQAMLKVSVMVRDEKRVFSLC